MSRTYILLFCALSVPWTLPGRWGGFAWTKQFPQVDPLRMLDPEDASWFWGQMKSANIRITSPPEGVPMHIIITALKKSCRETLLNPLTSLKHFYPCDSVVISLEKCLWTHHYVKFCSEHTLHSVCVSESGHLQQVSSGSAKWVLGLGLCFQLWCWPAQACFSTYQMELLVLFVTNNCDIIWKSIL